MKNFVIFFLFIFVFVQNSKKIGRNCQNFNYSWSNLVLTWPGDFCRQPNGKDCDNNDWYQNWDGRTFSIHGLWPSSSDDGFLKCIKSGTDKYCDDKYSFRRQILNLRTELTDKMNKYWPDMIGNDFWRYEWNKHGVCYLNLLKRKNITFSDDSIFRDYFNKAVTEYVTLTNNFNLTKGVYNDKQELFKDLNINPKYGYPHCRKQNKQYYLMDIYLCYSLPQKAAGDEYLIECPIFQNKCEGRIHLLNYKPAIGKSSNLKINKN